MFNKFLARFESPDRPLLGPNVRALLFWGVLLPKSGFKRKFYLFMHLWLTLFIFTSYVDIWFVKDDMNQVLYNLKITMLATISCVKVLSFLAWQNDWWDVIDYVTKADIAARSTEHPRKRQIVTSYTKYSRRMTVFYFALMYATVVTIIAQPFIKYVSSPTYRRNVRDGTESYLEVVRSWVPFDKNTQSGYLVASLIQSLATMNGGGWITCYDSNAFVLMVFIKAQLELLRIDCAEIFGTEAELVSNEIALERLKECHRNHVELIKYVRVLDSCLSPNMLLYVLICSAMFCVSAFQVTAETNTTQQFMTAEYLTFCIAQLFIYCWHSTNVSQSSLHLSSGPYESQWWNRDIPLRKNLLILTAQLNQAVVFTAGPFTELTMATWINILKGAYSYYTLLRNSQI